MAVVYATTAARVSDSVDNDSGGPSVGEVWIPAEGTPFHVAANGEAPQAVARVTKASPAAYDLASVRVRVFTLDNLSFTDYVPAVSLVNSGATAIMTVTGFPLYGSGQLIQFYIGYSGTLDFTAATYPVSITFSAYLPDVMYAPQNLATDPCTAIVADPLVSYQIAQDYQYRFFSLTVPQTSTVYMTATNYSVNGQMQFRHPPSSPCVPTGTAEIIEYVALPSTPQLTAYNVSPGNYLARFSADSVTNTTPFTFVWNYVPGTVLMEPNNSPCGAIDVLTNTVYSAYPDDLYDYYGFNTSVTGTIQITIANYAATGQYQIRKNGTSCADSVIAYGPVASSASVVTMTAVNQPAGRYYLAVLSTGGLTTAQAYRFRIATNPQVWDPNTVNINTCTPMPAGNNHCPGNLSGGKIPVYWVNAPAATHVTVTVSGMQAIGACPAGSTTIPVGKYTPATTPDGSLERTGIPNGYYSLKLEISGPLGYRSRSDMSVKMGCDFAASVGEDAAPIVVVEIPPPVDAMKPIATPHP